MDSINLNMRSVEVSCESRAIRAEYTKEMAFELDSFSNINAEEELSKLLAEQMSWERSIRRKKSVKNIYRNEKTS